MRNDLSFGAQVATIWSEAWRLLCAAPASVVAYLVVLTIAVTLFDLYAPEAGATFVVNMGALAAYFVLTVEVISKGIEGGRQGGKGFLTYFGLSILSGIAIAIGLLLLIIPGLILWARWMPAYGYAMGNGLGVIDSLSESWDATSGHVVPILGAVLPPYLIGIAGFGAVILLVEGAGPSISWSSLIGNALLYATQAVVIAIGLAIFSLLARQDVELAEVFA